MHFYSRIKITPTARGCCTIGFAHDRITDAMVTLSLNPNNIMNIILLGYGKMGRIIERVAIERGHTITARIDRDNSADLALARGDVAIEFSHPEAAFDNVHACLAQRRTSCVRHYRVARPQTRD